MTTTTVRRSARLQHKEPDNEVPEVTPESLESAPAPPSIPAPDTSVLGLALGFSFLFAGAVGYVTRAEPLYLIASVVAEVLVVIGLWFFRAGWIRGFVSSHQHLFKGSEGEF